MAPLRFANPLFVALDTSDLRRALSLAQSLRSFAGGLKVGLEFITAQGPEGIRAIARLGLPVFADVKFHDIPNTVAGAAKAISALGVTMFNVHASGGEAMLRAAVAAVQDAPQPPLVLGVTVLTSLGDTDLVSVGQMPPARTQVQRLAELAKRTGLDGAVCSPHEIAAIRETCGDDFLIVTPGVRPTGADLGDQHRVMTPGEAMRAGADIIVVGRPITGAADPAAAARSVFEEVKDRR